MTITHELPPSPDTATAITAAFAERRRLEAAGIDRRRAIAPMGRLAITLCAAPDASVDWLGQVYERLVELPSTASVAHVLAAARAARAADEWSYARGHGRTIRMANVDLDTAPAVQTAQLAWVDQARSDTLARHGSPMLDRDDRDMGNAMVNYLEDQLSAAIAEPVRNLLIDVVSAVMTVATTSASLNRRPRSPLRWLRGESNHEHRSRVRDEVLKQQPDRPPLAVLWATRIVLGDRSADEGILGSSSAALLYATNGTPTPLVAHRWALGVATAGVGRSLLIGERRALKSAVMRQLAGREQAVEAVDGIAS